MRLWHTLAALLLIQLADGSANSRLSPLSYKNIHSEELLKPVFCISSVLDIMTGLWVYEVQGTKQHLITNIQSKTSKQLQSSKQIRREMRMTLTHCQLTDSKNTVACRSIARQ
jgi:hypothetical protein